MVAIDNGNWIEWVVETDSRYGMVIMIGDRGEELLLVEIRSNMGIIGLR